MSRPLHTITSAMRIYREGDSPIFGESAVSISIDDDGGGWFFVIETSGDEPGKIRVDLDELRLLLTCAEELAKQEPRK